MRCPICESTDNKVMDVRDSNGYPRRRRLCKECEYRFTTYELELGRLAEIFEDHIKNPEILAAVTAIIEKELPAPREQKPGGRKRRA